MSLSFALGISNNFDDLSIISSQNPDPLVRKEEELAKEDLKFLNLGTLALG